MFQTFTGSSRRPRQVNLSGRNPNPWASLGAGSGSQAALASAQQERQQRQQEREKLNATKRLQRVWRGHRVRRKIKQAWREDWDAVELEDDPDRHQIRPYASEERALLQARRFLQFATTRSDDDRRRLERLGKRLMGSTQAGTILPSGEQWLALYPRLQKRLLSVLDYRISTLRSEWGDVDLLEFLGFTVSQIPKETAKNGRQYYNTMATLVQNSAATKSMGLILELLVAPLRVMTAETLLAYEAFAAIILTIPSLTEDIETQAEGTAMRGVLDGLAESINYKLLASALAEVVKSKDYAGYAELTDSKARIRLLGSFIYFNRHAHNFQDPQAYSSNQDFITVVSTLLSSIPEHLNIETSQDYDGGIDEEEESTPAGFKLSSFLQDQITSLVNQESVQALLSGTSISGSHLRLSGAQTEKGDYARQLASYALNLLRFFPRRSDEIRMWLYLGSTTGSTGSSQRLSAISYFWQASKASGIFQKISKDPRAAIPLLKPYAPPVSQYGWKAPSALQEAQSSVEDEWRVIFIFMELYTFVLKLMDDEEFMSSGNESKVTSSGTSWSRDNALPLSDIKDLTVFLKNLAFTLYVNSSEIASNQDRSADSTSISSFFSTSAAPRLGNEAAQDDQKYTNPSLSGIAGMSIEYIKGTVTGLIRMIYERDSRRKFLPKDHWLMTQRLDMVSFIGDVVAEEEKRHSIEEEDGHEDVEMEDDVEDTRLVGTGYAQQVRASERLRRQQQLLRRQNRLRAVAPRLEILQNMPFFIPFMTRVEIFRNFVAFDKSKRRLGFVDADNWRQAMLMGPMRHHLARHKATIRRNHEFEDAYQQFFDLKEDLKEPITITFVDQFGAQEEGIDGGGVTKEFLTSVTSQAFSPAEDGINLFVENAQHLLYPNPSAIEEQKEILRQANVRENSTQWRLAITELLQRYEFLGRIVGKCLYEGILVDINFAPFFLLKWALTGGTGSAPKESGYRANINDLRDLDEELYQGLLQLKNYPGNVEDLGLDFTVTDTVVTDRRAGSTKTITRELKPGGANIPVTNENRLVYISYLARYRLQTQPYAQTSAFLRGLSSMIKPSWLSMFNQSEIQTLLGGTNSSIDVVDLRRNTQYGGLYVIGDDGLEHPTIQLFWQVMAEFGDEERRAVLKFVTSTPRAPLMGFASLNPPFSIKDSNSDPTRLPSASTCVNLLKLPVYKDKETLRSKLRLAIFSGAGFAFS